MYKALAAGFDQPRADRLKDLYRNARRKLFDEALTRIAEVEPGMTDHSASHVANVLDNADHLLAADAFEATPPRFSAADAYTLCLSILFHDAGMVYGRDDHEQQIARVYEWVRQSAEPPLQEKGLVYRAARAHTGRAANGSRDTIADVPATMDLDGAKVQLRELAAILRFADELAEGPQRTSSLVPGTPLTRGEDNQVHHDYAGISNVHIDRDLGRIALTYRFDIGDRYMDPKSPEFHRLMEYTFGRIAKLDGERRYARFYSRHLAPFTRTNVVLNFWINGSRLVDMGHLELSDKGALDQESIDLGCLDSRYDVDTIVSQLARELEEAE